MNFNPSDFTLNDLITVNKEYLNNKFFKLHIENKDYVIYVSRVGVSLMDIEVYNIKHQIDVKFPIEHELISFNKQWDVHVDFFNPECYYHDLYLGDFLENYKFELSEINDKTINYLHVFFQNDNLIMLISNTIIYKRLKNPTNIFEEEFYRFIHEICINQINESNYLLKKLMDIKEKKEKEKKELEKHMKKVEKEHRRLAAKYGDVVSYSGERVFIDVEKILR